MPSRFIEALRERLTLRNIGFAVAVFGGLHFVLGASTDYVASSLLAALVTGTTDLVGDAYDLRDSVRGGGIGLSALAGGAAMFFLAPEDPWLALVFLLVGAWFVLDAVQTARHEGATIENETRDGNQVYREYVSRRVHETLKERAMTRRELDEKLDADTEVIDTALDELLAEGVIERAGSEFRVTTREADGRIARVRSGVGRFLGRIARPITIEFQSDSSAESAERGGPNVRDRDNSGGEGESERIEAER